MSGLDGSGIDASRIVEGRLATIVGIVRRPYPTATDQRFAIVPRSIADVGLAPSKSLGRSAGHRARVSRVRHRELIPAGPDRLSDRVAAPDIDLTQLSAHLGQVVRVGGIVAALAPDGVDLDDGTATARLLLTGDAAMVLALLEPGDALNAVGTPEQRDEVVLVVGDPAGLVLAGGTSAVAAVEGMPSVSPDARADDRTISMAGMTPDLGVDLAPAGLGTMLMLVLSSFAVTVARRHRARRGLQARIVARLAAFGASGRRGRPGSRLSGHGPGCASNQRGPGPGDRRWIAFDLARSGHVPPRRPASGRRSGPVQAAVRGLEDPVVSR